MTDSQQKHSQVLLGRLKTIDGLRGIAAISVVVYHLHGHLQNEISQWFHGAVSHVLMLGYLGVPVFFVLSGFVITMSVGRNVINRSFWIRFALRRSVRLDPPYWLSIAAAISLSLAAAHAFPGLHKTLPSLPKILAHLFYLQDLLGYGDIVPIYWTLCFEVQFYMLLLLMLYSAQRLSQTTDTRELLSMPLLPTAAVTLALLSLLEFRHVIHIAHLGLCLRYWYCFSLGMLCYWSIAGWMKPTWFAVCWICATIAALTPELNAMAIAAVSTAGLLYVGGVTGRLRTWLDRPLLQYLGRLSYSLYLFHGIVGWSSVSLFERLIGPPFSVPQVILAFCVGLVASVAAAHVAYVLAEAPSVRLSRRVPVSTPDGTAASGPPQES